MRFFHFAWLFFPIVLTTAIGCGGRPAPTETESVKPPPVRTALAKKMDVPRRILTVGTAKPSVTVQVRARVDGQIKAVYFKEGALVSKGQLLFEIDSESFEATLKEAESTLESSKAQEKVTLLEKDRSAKLVKAGAIPQELFEKAVASHESAVASVARDISRREVARLNLGYCRVLAPITGIAGKMQTDGGSLTRGYDARTVITINQFKPIFVEFALAERHLGQIRAARDGQDPFKIEIRKDEKSPAIPGLVSFLDNHVDSATGTITLRAEFPNANGAIWPGEFFEVVVIVGVDKGALVIPLSALVQGYGGTHCYVMGENGRVKFAPIKVSRIEGEMVLVESGVDEGAMVVTEGTVRLKDGMEVRDIGGTRAP